MSEHAPEAVQAIHDAWVAEKAAGGVPDPGFPGEDGGLYYSDDDDFWAHFDAPRGRFEPEAAEAVQEAYVGRLYVERLHPRDRLGKWARKFGPAPHGGPVDLLRGKPKLKRGKGGRKAPVQRRATADWKKRVDALSYPAVPARHLIEMRREAMGFTAAPPEVQAARSQDKQEIDEYLHWWFGEPGKVPGAVQTVSGDPGTLFIAQHARIMEAGAILDAEVTRRMNANPQVERRRALEKMLREHKAKRKEAEQREHAETWEFLARRMNAHTEVIGRDRQRHQIESKTPEEWEAIYREYMRHTEARYSRQMKWKIPDAEKYGPVLWDLYEFRYTDAEREGIDLQGFYDKVYEAKGKVWDTERAIDDLGIDENVLRRDQAYEVLSEVREFADVGDLVIHDDKGEPIPMGESDDWPHPRWIGGVNQLAQAAKWLPLDWVKESNEYGFRLTVGWSEGRGKYIHNYQAWAGQGEEPGTFTGGFLSRIIGSPSPAAPQVEQGEGTMLHELVHRAEHTRDGITGAEWTFYTSRVSPGRNMRWQDTKKLSDVTGSDSYEDYERTRVDDFTNAYSGKTYGDEPDSSWEILTMGIEDLVTGAKGIIDKDDEFRQFVFGSLALL